MFPGNSLRGIIGFCSGVSALSEQGDTFVSLLEALEGRDSSLHGSETARFNSVVPTHQSISVHKELKSRPILKGLARSN